MAIHHIRTLTGGELGPSPAIVEVPCAAVEFGNQLTDRPGLVQRRIEPRVIDLQKYPLRPPIEVDVRGGEAAALVMSESQPAQLATKVDNIGFGSRPRMGTGLNGVLLGRKSE